MTTEGQIKVEQLDNGYWLWSAVASDPDYFRVAVVDDEVTAHREARECLAALERMAAGDVVWRDGG